MPQRHRSHQLEDESRREFEGRLPREWVARTKSHDYGIDLEVEIFHPDGSATGHLFYVQLRATHNVRERLKLRLDADQIRYFHSLVVPTVIARYCARDRSFHWKWHHEVDAPFDLQQKTKTIHFDETNAWDSKSPDLLFRALGTISVLRELSTRERLPILTDFSKTPNTERFRLETAFENARRNSKTIRVARDDEIGLLVASDGTTVSFGFPPLRALSSSIRGQSTEEMGAELLYGIAAVAGLAGLARQANDVASAALDLGLPATDKILALRAALAIQDPRRSSSLAILNELFRPDTSAATICIAYLASSSADTDVRAEALSAFHLAVLGAAKETKVPFVEAAAEYSLGNFLRSKADYHAAIRHYNRARKLRPKYQSARYFLEEVGSCFYLSRRYRCAVAAYERAFLEAPTARESHLLGDALLFAGRPRNAAPQFLAATSTDDVGQNAEANLKHELCEWLLEHYGSSEVPASPSQAREYKAIVGEPLAEEQFAHIVEKLDALDELSNFNLGLEAARRNDWVSSLPRFLICAFKLPSDFDAWRYALMAALNVNPLHFVLTLAAAISATGMEGYSQFRSALLEHGVSEDELMRHDEIWRTLSSMLPSQEQSGLTVRILAPDAGDGSGM